MEQIPTEIIKSYNLYDLLNSQAKIEFYLLKKKTNQKYSNDS